MITEFRVSKKDAVEAERHHSSLSEFIMHYLEKRATQDEKEKARTSITQRASHTVHHSAALKAAINF